MGKTFGIRFDHNTVNVVVTEKNSEGKVIFLDACSRKVPLTPAERISFERVKENKETLDRHQRRSARRNRQRYLLRRRQLISLFKEKGFISDDTPLTDSVVDADYNTWERRAAAVHGMVTLEDLARVLLMMNKHRGYKASQKAKAGDDEGSVIDGTEHALQMQELGMTPAQYLRHLTEKGIEADVTFYPSDLKDELELFLDTQEAFHPELITPEVKDAVGRGSEKTVSLLLSRNVENTSLGKKELKDALLAARAQAADGEMVSPEFLEPVICSLMHQIKGSSEYLGLISDRSKEITLKGITPGEWMWERIRTGGNAFNTKSNVFFRSDYMKEFDRIWETQKQYHPQLTDELKKQVKDHVLFYQRSLKSQKGSWCPFESFTVTDGKGTHHHGCRTAPKSSPLFQEYRLWHDLNNVTYRSKDDNTTYALDREMIHKAAAALRVQESMKDTALLKLLKIDGKKFELNFKEVKGNATVSAIHNALTKEAKARGLKTALDLLNATGADVSILDYDWSLPKEEYERQSSVRLWILIDSYEGDSSVSGMDTLRRQIAEKFAVDQKTAYALSMITFPDGHGALSHKAMKKLLPHLTEGTGYYDACLAEGYTVTETAHKGKLAASLPAVKKGEMFNPTAEKIINQVINVINALIDVHGNPEMTVLEMPRELNASVKIRKAMQESMKQREAENKRFTQEIIQITGNPNVTSSQLLRYRLYQELKENGYRTLYSNRKIEPQMVFDVKMTHREHIIPQSVIFDDNYVNYTLEFADVDKEKKDQTARDYVLSKYGQKGLDEYKARVEHLYKKNAISKAKYNYLLMTKGDVPNNILDRQTPARQYAMKQLSKMLAQISEKVLYTTSGVTSALKRDWGLGNVITDVNARDYMPFGRVEKVENADGKEFNKITVRSYVGAKWTPKNWTPIMDPRSGVVDAAVIACTTPAHIILMNNLNDSKDRGSQYWAMRNRLTTFNDGKRQFRMPQTDGDLAQEVMSLVQRTLVSVKGSGRLMSKRYNVTKSGKSRKDIKVQKTGVPRGELHNASTFSRRTVIEGYEKNLGTSMTLEHVMCVADPSVKKVLLDRLAEYNNDSSQAFSKKEIRKRPLWQDEKNGIAVPETIRCNRLEDRYFIRKPINDSINVDKICDEKIRAALEERIRKAGSLKAAVEDLMTNPLRVDGHIVRKATIVEKSDKMVPIRFKRDHKGEFLKDESGELIPNDWVMPGDNHHVNIYRTTEGELEMKLVTFLESVTRVNQGKDPYEKDHRANEGWTHRYHLCKGDMVVFPDVAEGFLPEEMTVEQLNESPHTAVNLFFVQKMSNGQYVFRHHTDNNVEMDPEMKNFRYRIVSKGKDLTGVVKVHVNHIGKITKKF